MSASASAESQSETVYCRECGAEIRRAAEICPECGVHQRAPPNSPAVGSVLDGRNPLVAVVCSAIFPGLGHVYARKVEMGLFFAVAFLCSIVTLFFGVGLLLVPAVWVYAAYDAAKTAQARDDELAGATAA
jgi:TM2 domain-containing membrane protein YozV